MKFFSHGVLGMNARNLKYIRAKNTGDSVSLADSKLKTKNFLSGRGIPFSETYAVIGSQQELGNFSFDSLPSVFVIKPNHGSKGQGILIVKKLKNHKFLIDGRSWSEDEVRLHMKDTLGGAFSLYGNYDRVVIEELLMPGKDFAKYCRHGLADIRMIVYNYVPITAMVRMPTELSGGKANLAQGGIGLGLNIANGEVMSFFQNKKNYTDIFPDGYEFLKHSLVPFWDKILLYSSQIQFYTGLGYLALDWVITKNGPKLLEINARAGLEIQNVNLVPLAKRLEQVDDLRIRSPEKGVEIAKTLFHSDVASSAMGKKIIYFEQRAVIRGTEVTLRVDPSAAETRFSPDLKKKITKNTIALLSGGVQLPLTPSSNFLSADEKNLILLGHNDLADCLIAPGMPPETTKKTTSRYSAHILTLDEKVYRLGKKLNFSSIFRPTNYSAELEKFLESPHHYNPVFEYPFPDDEKLAEIEILIDDIHAEIAALPDQDAIFQKLYGEKLRELRERRDLILAYRDENHAEIARVNAGLFGEFDNRLLDIATKKVLENARMDTIKQEKLLGTPLSVDEIRASIESYLKEHDIPPVPIRISSATMSRMAVAYKGDSVHINISESAVIRQNEMPAILAHELGTHLRRYQNAQKYGLQLLKYGTAYYLTDEEGLAIYHSLWFVPDGYEKNAMYLKYYLLAQADTLSFVQTVALLQSIYPDRPLDRVFRQAFRLKRGIQHTEVSGIHGTVYMKDKIYLDGYMKIKRWIEEGWDISLMSAAKVKISDLPLIAKL